jgi:plastocyanin
METGMWLSLIVRQSHLQEICRPKSRLINIDYKLVDAKSLTLTILLAGVMVIAIVIPANFSSAAGQQVHGDYLVRIPQGATEQEGVYYEPGHIAIPAGTTVVWPNDDPGQLHTVTSDEPDSDQAGLMFHSGIIPTDTFFQYTFDEPSEYPYHCEVHPWATGSVFVSDDVSEGEHFVLRYGTGQVFDFTEHERTLLTFEPMTIDIMEDQTALYEITITRAGEAVLSEQFQTIGGSCIWS